ncbi:hypothetical protein OESDEN_02543 [Oesophagostomum dentatum]|uniref:Uncharacterized protein n=1 Tax=Oesophagostomum dentatum TaxID=61180 RepID=A0A0B1TMZ0_OESDE|nr:hypothetical protein OESDEN_02543 [Oesophagostomum dentatum]
MGDKGFEILLERAKFNRENDELLYLVNGFFCFYFAILAVTLLKNISEYQINEAKI